MNRLVGINVESHQWPEESKVWPHLGILYVGTIAAQAGYEVTLWDELIQGPTPLEQLIQPGDIVGLSLVITGIERGVKLARAAKQLGAECVIAGNDAAAFRARQLLELPGKPIDAVFTSNSLVSIRAFFEHVSQTRMQCVSIPNVAIEVMHAGYVSNESQLIAKERKRYGSDDFFLVPDLALFGREYWELVWSAYRSQFGHLYPFPQEVRNATVLFAQGCGRAGAGSACDYCGIRNVANVVVPGEQYLEKTMAAYQHAGMNAIFNTTDSAYEMGTLVDRIGRVGARIDSLVLYARAQAIVQRPDLLEKWIGLVNEWLMLNCGMDSANERILQSGIGKSTISRGSRVQENKEAIRIIKAAGSKARLHFSVIFGSLMETHDSCEETLEFIQWASDVLGHQLMIVEGDQLWINPGAQCFSVLLSHDEAARRAAQVGKSITRDEWYQHFGRYADELIVPWSCQEAWYRFFTHISIEDAYEYNNRTRNIMNQIPGRIRGRHFAFKPPE